VTRLQGTFFKVEESRAGRTWETGDGKGKEKKKKEKEEAMSDQAAHSKRAQKFETPGQLRNRAESVGARGKEKHGSPRKEPRSDACNRPLDGDESIIKCFPTSRPSRGENKNALQECHGRCLGPKGN